MSKKIGNLAVVVSGNTASLEKSLNHAAKQVQEFNERIAHMGERAMSFLEPLIAALGIGLTTEKFFQTAEAIEAVGRSADKFDITTKALMGLHYAAKMADVSTEDFDAGFQTMLKNVGMAAQGTGRAKAALEDLNIDPKKLQELSSENQFKVLSEAISQIDDPARRTADAMRIFGDQGAALLPMMKQGAEGIYEAQQEAEKMNVTLSEVDIAQVEMMQDSVKQVQIIIGSIIDAIVVELSPYVKAAADAFVEWSNQGMSWREIVGGAVEWVVHAVAKLSDLVDYGKIAWYGLKVVVAAQIWAMMLPLQGMIDLMVKLIDLSASVLPQSVVDGAHQVAAFTDGLMDGIKDGMKEDAKKVADIWTGPSTSDKVDAFFANLKKKNKDAAQAIADSKDHREDPWDDGLLDQVRADNKELDKQLELTQKIRDVRFGENKIIRAGSASAQSITLDAYSKVLDNQVREQIELQKQQLAAQKKQAEQLAKIASNTADMAESEAVSM